jgi:hypothetical protein
LGRVPVANRGVTNLATIGGDGPLAVPYGNVILNSDASVFSVSGGTLTVLKEGHIAAIAVLELSFPTAGASAASIVDWKVNGVSTSSGILNVFNADSAHINDQVIAALSFHLNAGDTIELHASCGSTAPPCPTIWNGHLSVSWFGVP